MMSRKTCAYMSKTKHSSNIGNEISPSIGLCILKLDWSLDKSLIQTHNAVGIDAHRGLMFKKKATIMDDVVLVNF